MRVLLVVAKGSGLKLRDRPSLAVDGLPAAVRQVQLGEWLAAGTDKEGDPLI